MLARAIASVRAQAQPPAAHLIRVQDPGLLAPPVHMARQKNALLPAVETPWVAVLDDDDEYLPNHFSHVLPAIAGADDDVAVVYTYAREGAVARFDATTLTASELERLLMNGNVISSNAAIRVSALAEVDAWSERRSQTGAVWDDHDLWIRLARAGYRFACVPVETWDYHHHDGNSSR